MSTVFLVTSAAGWDNLLSGADIREAAIWFSRHAIEDNEYDRYVKKGFNMSRFSYDVSKDTLNSDLETIQEHHPNVPVWVEFSSED